MNFDIDARNYDSLDARIYELCAKAMVGPDVLTVTFWNRITRLKWGSAAPASLIVESVVNRQRKSSLLANKYLLAEFLASSDGKRISKAALV